MSSRTLKQVNEIVGFSININETDYQNIKYELNKIGDLNSIEIANEMIKRFY